MPNDLLIEPDIKISSVIDDTEIDRNKVKYLCPAL